MFRFATDENFHQPVIDGLMLRHPEIGLIRVVDVGYASTPDEVILEWAASEDRILLTHDRSTMERFAYQRVSAGLFVPGVLIFPQQPNVGIALAVLDIIINCSEPYEWIDRVEHFQA